LLELKVDRGAQPGEPFSDQPTVPMERPDMPAPAPSPSSGASHTAMINLNANHGGRERVKTLPMPQMPFASGIGQAPPPSPEASEGAPGKLVVVSTNFAGREFVLEKPAMVIGRTDDNDIVVNHRSISRHHAKIVREGGRYAVVDMQSANGVRVNGEEYGKVELRRGDMIDLGHVRLRYVDPGEDFVFDRDATMVDIHGGGKKGKGLLIGLVSVGVLGAAAVAVILVIGKGNSTGTVANNGTNSVPNTLVTEAKTTSRPGTAAVSAPETTPATTALNPENPLAKHLGDAQAAIDGRRWAEAIVATQAAMKLDPRSNEALKLQNWAKSEMKHETLAGEIKAALDANRLPDAQRLLKNIVEGSAYHTESKEMIDNFIIQKLEAEAKAFASKGQCDKIAGVARRAPTEDAKASIAATPCTPTVGVVSSAPVSRPVSTPISRPVTAVVSAPPAGDPNDMLAEAKVAYNGGQYAQAKKLLLDVLKLKPGQVEAVTFLAIIGCKEGKKADGLRYANQLTGKRQELVKSQCRQSGVDLDAP
jgi:ABC transport system ATP-binding/permease protein